MKSGALKPPRAVTAPPAADAKGVGYLTPGFEEGSLLLRNKAGEHVRLAWYRDERATAKKSTDQRRALPAGEWTLTGYRLVGRGGGHTWFLSATKKNIRRVVVRAGEAQRVAVDGTVHLRLQARAAADGVAIQAGIAGEHQSGLSIYRDGKRIAIPYRVTSAEGRELASGTLEYG